MDQWADDETGEDLQSGEEVMEKEGDRDKVSSVVGDTEATEEGFARAGSLPDH